MAGKERHSIDAVATVKKIQDRFDWLHIYEVNDCKRNNWPLYIFKSLTPMAKIALPIPWTKTMKRKCHFKM